MTRLFLAGATGAIGRRLIPILVDAGHSVVGTTRSSGKTGLLRDLGAEGVVVDVYDADALARAVRAAAPEAVHQLTDLPQGLDPSRMGESIAANARLRCEGTRNLVAASLAAGVERVVAQSIAWAYAPKSAPFLEDDPLDRAATGARGVSIGGVAALEDAVLTTRGLAGCVLRYGQLYGPGTGRDEPNGDSPVHVDAAAHAVLLALQRRATGPFNVAEYNETVSTDRARLELGWCAGYRWRGRNVREGRAS